MTLPSPREPATFSALVPFSGFYDSWHSENVDQAEERMFSGDDGQPVSQALYEMFWSNIDYRPVFLGYAKAYVKRLGEEIGIALYFEEMQSPREYNFETDRLFAKVGRADLAKMLRAVRGKRLNEKIAERCTSRSGFVSFYPNHISRWPRIAEWDHNHVGIVLECYVEKLVEEGACPREDQLVEEFNTELTIEEWLVEASEADTEAARKAARALRLNDYLRQRAERKYSHSLVPA